ncbi:MAG TPA: Mur ligase family protein, partial [Ilumatobacteraceae bacterium]|nr:Mur ligase family protein [Ilumatobacteraceae bacterium]
VAVGNTEVPLVEVIDDEAIDAFVVECSSFRLNWTTCFRPDAAVWLNLAPDHLNWHTGLDSYVAAKTRMWRHQRSDDTAIGLADDAVVMAALERVNGRAISFGFDRGDYRSVAAGDHRELVGPAGPLTTTAAMRRALPHDVTNALAAAALVQQAGLAGAEAIAAALADFVGPPHRIEPVGSKDGVA